jgi:hypothetical protein
MANDGLESWMGITKDQILLGWIIYLAGLENQNRAKSKPVPAFCGLNERGLNKIFDTPILYIP